MRKCKMKKLIIFLMLLFLLVPQVLALPMCRDTVDINNNCTMATPVISCTNASYAIFNTSNGAVMQNNSLESIGNGLYIFNFTQPEGGYVVKLCDATTREVKVTFPEDDNMALGVIILLPILLGMMFMFSSFKLGEHHPALAIFLWLISPLFFLTSFHFGLLSIVKLYGWAEMQNLIGSTTYWVTIVIAVLFIYWFLFIIIKALTSTYEKKQQKIEFS